MCGTVTPTRMAFQHSHTNNRNGKQHVLARMWSNRDPVPDRGQDDKMVQLLWLQGRKVELVHQQHPTSECTPHAAKAGNRTGSRQCYSQLPTGGNNPVSLGE